MADESVIISNLPTHTPVGSDYLAVEDISVTGKATVDDVVAAAEQVQTNKSAIGVLSSLTTSAKSNLVAAINEVDAHADTNATDIATLNAIAFLRRGPLPSGSVGDVFTNGVFALTSANTYTGLPSGFTVGTLLSFKPQPNSNYYAVHIIIALNRTIYVQNYTTAWSAWTQIGS